MQKAFYAKLAILFLFANYSLITAQEAKPVFVDGRAQVVEAFEDSDDWIRHDLWVETSFDSDGDGQMDRMHVAVTRPQQTETEGLKLPVIYISSPYFAGVARPVDGLFWDVKHELGERPKPRVHPEVKRTGKRPIISNSYIKTWVPRGYIVVHSSSPGTGLSDGAPTCGGLNESLAPKAVIDWLCVRIPGYTSRDGNEQIEAYWSTGKVGMTGVSYNGTLSLAAATTGVEGLKAIIPVAPNTSYYHYYRSNGLVRSPGGYLGEDIDVLYDFIHSGDEDKRAYNNATIRDTEMKNGIDRITGDFNDFWASRDYLNRMDAMKAALFMSHGFNDWNVMPEHSFRIYQAAKEKGIPTQLYYHQNGHGGPPPTDMMNKWFTRYLHGVENGVEQDAPVWIVRENDSRDKPSPYQNYPHPKSSMVSLYLHPGAPEKGSLRPDKPAEVQRETLVDDYTYSGADLARAESSTHRLLFVSPVLAEDLHLSGVPEITLSLASNKAAANLSVWLVSLPWDNGMSAKITDNIITRGWADPQNYQSLTESDSLVPGQFYDLNFKLNPDDQVVRKGQQIGLLIFSSDREFTLWPEPGTELTIDLSGSSLKLPIVGGEATYLKAIQAL